jgi:hypothetical protein
MIIDVLHEAIASVIEHDMLETRQHIGRLIGEAREGLTKLRQLTPYADHAQVRHSRRHDRSRSVFLGQLQQLER